MDKKLLNFLRSAILLSFFLSFLTSCIRDDIYNANAKNDYYKIYNKNKNRFQSTVKIPFEIEWNKGKTSYSDYFQDNITTFPIALKVNGNPNNKTHFHLIAKGSDEHVSFYLLKVNPSFNSKNLVASITDQKDFTGQLKLFLENDELAFDKRYKDGVYGGQVFAGMKPFAKINTQAQDAEMECLKVFTYHYTDHYFIWNVDNVLTYSHTTLDAVTEERVCYPVGGGSIGGGLGNWSGPDTGGGSGTGGNQCSNPVTKCVAEFDFALSYGDPCDKTRKELYGNSEIKIAIDSLKGKSKKGG